VKKYLLAVLVLTLACPGGKIKEKVKKVSIDDVVGGYTVEGTNPNGSKYKGTMVFENEQNVLKISGSIEATGQNFKGIGLLMDDVVAISYSIELADKPGEQGDLNLTVYKIQPDGSLEGRWSYEGGIGTEIAKKIK
jgi:hypothetical protein